MKLSVSLVSGLLLASLGCAMHNYAWEAENSLPYYYMLSEDEIVNFSMIAFDMERDELTELIRLHLVSKGALADDDQFPAQPEAVPMHHGLGIPMPGGDVDAAAIPLPPDHDHHHPQHHHQPQPVPIMMHHNANGHLILQVPQGMNIQHVLGGQGGDQPLMNVLGMLLGGQAGGNHHVVIVDNGLGGAGDGFENMDPFTVDDDHFEAYLAFPENFFLPAFNTVIAECDINNAPSERVFRMLLAAAEHESISAFEFLCDGMFKSMSAESGDTLKKVMVEITKPGKDPRYLECYLKDCTPMVAKEIGELLNPTNAHLHQIFVSKCGVKIPISVIGNLVGVSLPDELAKLVTSNQSCGSNMALQSMKLAGSSAAETEKAVLKLFQAGPIQIAGFFPCQEQANEFPEFVSFSNVDSLASALHKAKDSIQFTVVYLDLSTGLVTIFKSQACHGAPISILHAAGNSGYNISTAVQDFMQRKDEEAFQISEAIQPGDIIVGCSAEMAAGLTQGFNFGVATNLSLSFDHTSADTVMEYLQMCNISPIKTSNMLVAVIPAQETETEIKTETENKTA